MSGIDYDTRHAMDVIARSIMSHLLDDPSGVGDMWEDHPEIGENDWIEIAEIVAERVKTFQADPEVYKAAYAHLASRADHL